MQNETRSSHAIICALLEQGTPVHFAPHGSSMTPLIREGDMVRVRPVDLPAIRAGHILLYHRHKRLVLHRVVGFDPAEKTYLTVADAALFGQDRIGETEILGVAEWVRHGARERRLDTCATRWKGLARFYLRPLRRRIFWVRQRIKSS